MEQSKNRGIVLKLAILWLAILLLGSFWLTLRASSDPVSLVVIPQAPREGEPVIATFKLNNPLPHYLVVDYQFYANGELLKEGTTVVAPGSAKAYKYACENPLQMGERLNFMVRSSSDLGNNEKVVSSPPYPPQVWSSFASFASFSTSVMSSMSTMTYYQSTFGGEMGLDVGIIASVVLIGLLVFFELSQPAVGGRTAARLGRLRIGFSTVTWMLFIVFMGIVYTRVVLILSS